MNWLQSRSKTGLGSDAMTQQLSGTGRAVAQQVDLAKGGIQGRAVSQGIEGSGVVAEQMVGADSAGTIAMANAARGIAEQNRKVKDQAHEKLGEYGIQATNQRYAEAQGRYAQDQGRLESLMGFASDIGSGILKDKEQGALIERLKAEGVWEQLSAEQKIKIQTTGSL